MGVRGPVGSSLGRSGHGITEQDRENIVGRSVRFSLIEG
jgi:hypothetical protein